MDENAFCEVVQFKYSTPFLLWKHLNETPRPTPAHWHRDIELNVIFQGDTRIDYYINGRHEVVTEGCVSLINSGEVHSCMPVIDKSRGDVYGATLLLNYEFLKRMIPNLENIYWQIVRPEDQHKIADLIHQMAVIYSGEENDAQNCRMISLMCEIMSVLCENCIVSINDLSAGKLKNSERMREILDYIHCNYSSSLTLDDMAQKFYFSRGYFSSFFKKYTGKTFKTYLTEVRILHAESMLKDTDKSISQIAQDTGFNDERRLIETFKKYYHITPGNFRKKEKL